MVGLETELALKRRLHRTLNTGLARETGAAQLSLDEELTVEESRRGVERCARDGRVNVVLRSNGMSKRWAIKRLKKVHENRKYERDQEPDYFEFIEATSIRKAGQNIIDEICVDR